MNLLTQVGTFVDAHGLAGAKGIVAVSGGPDSIALARALLHVPCSRLILAHVNHQLRGPESDDDEQFVAGLPALWRSEPGLLTCRTVRLDTAVQAKDHNLEAAAREQRYAWLAEVAHGRGRLGCRRPHR